MAGFRFYTERRKSSHLHGLRCARTCDALYKTGLCRGNHGWTPMDTDFQGTIIRQIGSDEATAL